MAYMTEATGPGTLAALGEDTTAARQRPMLLEYRIKRMGARPLVFRGMEIGMAMSFTPDLPYWYEINLFQTVDRTFVLVVKQFFQSVDERDTVQAWTFPTLAEAIDCLEAYDPAHDIRVGVAASAGDRAAPDLAAIAFDLRARAATARRHFKGLVGEFLVELDEAA